MIPSITKVEQLKGASVASFAPDLQRRLHTESWTQTGGSGSDQGRNLNPSGRRARIFRRLYAGKVQGAMLSPPRPTRLKRWALTHWSGLGVEYPSLVYAVRKSFLKDSEAVALRFLQAMAEGVHIFNTDKEAALEVDLAKYTKVTDRKVLEDSYNDNSGVHSPTLEPTRSGIANILETMAGTTPKVASARPEDFIDARLVKKLEESGFFKKLAGR